VRVGEVKSNEDGNIFEDLNVDNHCIRLFGRDESRDGREYMHSMETEKSSLLFEDDIQLMEEGKYIHVNTGVYADCVHRHQEKVKEFIQLYFKGQDLIRQERENRAKIEQVMMEIGASEREYDNLEIQEIKTYKEYLLQRGWLPSRTICCMEMETLNKHEEEVLEMEDMVKEQIELEASVIERRRKIIMRQYYIRQKQICIRRKKAAEAREFNRCVNVSMRRDCHGNTSGICLPEIISENISENI
jgi:hypothetical protein